MNAIEHSAPGTGAKESLSIFSGAKPDFMTSREIADLVDMGERHDNVKRTIDTLAERGVIGRPQFEDRPFTDAQGKARTEKVYLVGERDSYVVVARLSPEFTARLVDFWQQHRHVPPPPTIPTTAEAFASAFMMIAQQERQQAAQQRALQHLDQRIERVETAQTILTTRPANAESITHLRERVGKMFGLSAAVIDEVMRQSPYAPKPAGMVKNDHVDADGASYAIYWRKDVTATFARFVGECTPVTATMFTHPLITGRFRIVGKAVAA